MQAGGWERDTHVLRSLVKSLHRPPVASSRQATYIRTLYSPYPNSLQVLGLISPSPFDTHSRLLGQRREEVGARWNHGIEVEVWMRCEVMGLDVRHVDRLGHRRHLDDRGSDERRPRWSDQRSAALK